MTTANDLPPAGGRGHELFTERVIFYLHHRAQIEQWARLQYEAAPAVSRFLDSLREEVQERSGPWNVWSGLLRKYRCLMASPLVGSHDVRPSAGVALGWHSSVPATPEVAAETCPFVGVYADATSDVHGQVVAALEARDAHDGGHSMESSRWWPRFEYVTDESVWWTDLDRYREKLLAAFERMLLRYRDAIEPVVE